MDLFAPTAKSEEQTQFCVASMRRGIYRRALVEEFRTAARDYGPAERVTVAALRGQIPPVKFSCG
jgi:hypothetical protein